MVESFLDRVWEKSAINESVLTSKAQSLRPGDEEEEELEGGNKKILSKPEKVQGGKFDGGKIYSQEFGYCKVLGEEPEDKVKVEELAESEDKEHVIEKQTLNTLKLFIKLFNQEDPEKAGKILEHEIEASHEIGKLTKTINETLEDECLLVYKGMVLDPEKKFYEYKILSNEKLLAVYGRDAEEGGGSDGVRFYMRFPKMKEGDYWQTGRGYSYWDAIAFSPKMDIKVLGCALWKIYDREDRFSYGIRYKVTDKEGNEVVAKEWDGSHDDRSGHVDFMFPIMFKERDICQEPIVVKKGWKFHVASWQYPATGSDYMHYGIEGENHGKIKNKDRNKFVITSSDLHQNGSNTTCLEKGCIPGLYYTR